MEFYIYNKDDRKSKTLVNLGTTFNIDGTNYIIYYITQVEKTTIDIYIGKISYGDQCLVINKIDPEQQGKFLSVVKEILAGQKPKTEYSDYVNIIGTATIVLESVQKIQIPTESLNNIINYNQTEEPTVQPQNIQTDEEKDEEAINDYDMFNEDNNLPENKDNNQLNANDQNIPVNNTVNEIDNSATVPNVSDNNTDASNISDNNTESTNTSDNTIISSNDSLTSLDKIINEKAEQDKAKKNKKKVISTPLLILLIVVVIIGIAILVMNNLA